MGNLDHDLATMLVHGVRQILKVWNDAVGRKVHRAPPPLRAINGYH